MLGFITNIIIMIVAALFLKSKIKLSIVWFFSCFVPFFIFVYSGEQGDIEIAKDMAKSLREYIVNILECYLGILIVSLVWTIPILLFSRVLNFLLKKIRYKK